LQHEAQLDVSTPANLCMESSSFHVILIVAPPF
jgi:hypothetical protein